MKKSILEQFAADAINAPAAVTGGGGCGPKTKKSHHSKNSKKTKKTHSKKSGSKSGCDCK